MSDDLTQKLLNWVRNPDPPEPSEVRQTRRFLAATGGNEPLTEILMTVEKQLEKDRDAPLGPLREYLQDNEFLRSRIRLKISEKEPFQEARRRLLSRALERFHGRILNQSEGMFDIEVGDPEGRTYLRSLYNIEGEEIFRNKS